MKKDNLVQNIKILKLYLILFYLFVLSILIITGYTFSKYKSETIKTISGDIAKPILIVQKEDIKQINANSNQDNYEYNFSILNYDNNQYSEVALAYRIVVEVDNDNPVSYKVYDESGNEIEFHNNKSNLFLLDNTSQIKQSYKLVVSRIETPLKAGNITINIEGSQVING